MKQFEGRRFNTVGRPVRQQAASGIEHHCDSINGLLLLSSFVAADWLPGYALPEHHLLVPLTCVTANLNRQF